MSEVPLLYRGTSLLRNSQDENGRAAFHLCSKQLFNTLLRRGAAKVDLRLCQRGEVDPVNLGRNLTAGSEVQGYLANKKQPLRWTLQ